MAGQEADRWCRLRRQQRAEAPAGVIRCSWDLGERGRQGARGGEIERIRGQVRNGVQYTVLLLRKIWYCISGRIWIGGFSKEYCWNREIEGRKLQGAFGLEEAAIHFL